MTRRLLLTVALASVLAACDNTLDPFESAEGPPFAVYGYLDTERDTHVVRIEPVQPVAPFDPSRITAVLRDETAGVAVEMDGAVVTLDDGTPGLAYAAAMRVQSGHNYTLAVRAEGAGTTTARATVPALRPAQVETLERDSTGRLFLPLLLRGPSLPPTRFSVTYAVEVDADSVMVEVPYNAGQDAAGGYRYRLQVSRDRLALLSRLRRAPTDTLRLLGLIINVRDDGPEWATGTSDIANGFGFFSTIGRTTQTVVLPPEVIREIGFSP